jgi:hypothetical protein
MDDMKQLTAAHRCDRCGAQAYVRAELPSGGELLFCAHHAGHHVDKLREVGAVITDERAKLEGPPVAAVPAT